MAMKKTFLIIIALIVTSVIMPLTAQTEKNISEKEQKKLEKQAKKEARLEKEKQAVAKVKQLVKDSAFVFVANRLRGKGKSYSVNPSVNFMLVNGKSATYQFAFQRLAGWNGIGGATFDGDVVDYEYTLSENTKKASHLKMTFRPEGVGGLPSVTITFFATSATMNLTLDDGTRLTFDGEIKSIQESGVFKGNAVF